MLVNLRLRTLINSCPTDATFIKSIGELTRVSLKILLTSFSRNGSMVGGCTDKLEIVRSNDCKDQSPIISIPILQTSFTYGKTSLWALNIDFHEVCVLFKYFYYSEYVHFRTFSIKEWSFRNSERKKSSVTLKPKKELSSFSPITGNIILNKRRENWKSIIYRFFTLTSLQIWVGCCCAGSCVAPVVSMVTSSHRNHVVICLLSTRW